MPWCDGSEVQACRSRTCSGKSSAAACAFGFSARAVRMSPPGARPTPRSMRPGRERLQHAELLGHLQRAVVRQHHAGAADADARRARGDRGHQHLGRAADDGRQAVVLADPEALVAEALAMLRRGRACRGSRRLRCCRRRETDWSRTERIDGSLIDQPCGWVGSIQRTDSGFSTGSMSRLTATASPSLRTSTHSSTSVAAGVDLLVRHERRHVDEVARAGFGGELERVRPSACARGPSRRRSRFPAGRGDARRSSRSRGCARCRPTASARRRARS